MLRSEVSNSPPVIFCRWAGCVRMKSSLIDRDVQVADQAQVHAHADARKQVHRLFGTDRLGGAEDAVGAAYAVVQAFVAFLDRGNRGLAARSR